MNKRAQQLMPDGIPKWILCYDNGGRSIGRYTIVYTRKSDEGWFTYVACNEVPFDPQGFGQHGQSEFWPIDRPTYGHLGKRIPFTALPPDVQRLVISDYRAIWSIEP